MYEKKRIKMLIVVVAVILSNCLFFIRTKAETINPDVYDVVLFWGQDNMVGPVGKCKGMKDADYSSIGLERFSEKTGVEKGILDPSRYLPEHPSIYGYTSINHVNVPLNTSSNVYEYSYLNNSLNKVVAGTNTFGESLNVHLDSQGNPYFNSDTKGRVCTSSSDCSYIQISGGTIMAPWFGKEYYDKTGHKVVIVHIARGGKEIKHFLPHDDNAPSDSVEATSSRYYLYEAMVTKYKAAIKYLNAKHYKIGKKIDIVFQGETDAYAAQSSGTTKWSERYQTIHNSLKKDLGIDLSVVIYTARANGTNYYEGVQKVHAAQARAIRNNNDVILGSSYPYDRFVSIQNKYNGIYMGRLMPYTEALKQANLSTCNQCNNSLYFNSAVLSQIGLETARNVVGYYSYKEPMLLEELDGETISD